MNGTKLWTPTGGKDALLDGRLRAGIWNGNPIYFHYASQERFQKFGTDGKLNSTRSTRRTDGKHKIGVYLSPAYQCYNPTDAWIKLFFQEEAYEGSGNYIIIFAFNKQPEEARFITQPISQNSTVKEVIYNKDIYITEIDILYRGPNPFVADDKQ